MLVLRPVRPDDLAALYDLSLASGIGLTTLPPDQDVLKKKVECSCASFAANVKTPGEEYYLFVLEDLAKSAIVGTSGVFAAVGKSKPFYSYRLLHLTQVSHNPDMAVNTMLLQLVNDYAGATEIGTLFLHPDYRTGMNGALLSKARYLLLAAYPERFSDKIMAEIRGWTDENGTSPFWEAIGRHFFQMDFEEADRINGMGNSQFIADLMPKFPIYTNILPKEAQEVIGKPHDKARGAVRLLRDEGFRPAGTVDIFDAGPCYEAPLSEIKTVHKTSVHTVSEITECKAQGQASADTAQYHMLASARLPDFRIAADKITAPSQESISIRPELAKALNIDAGDRLLLAPLKRRESQK